MGRYTGPKDRLSRREGFDLFGKGAKLTRLTVPPGIHGHKSFRKVSQYGRQLREKQKVKRMYGLFEKQFKRYVDKASKTRGNTGEMGFAPTRASARQLVSHGHVLIDGKRVNIPSYQVKSGDTMTLSKKAMEIPAIKKLLLDKEYKTPGWIERKAAAGHVVRVPKRDDIPEQVVESDIVEFYSR